jgi:HSP20 family molecular chaperone IbpA
VSRFPRRGGYPCPISGRRDIEQLRGEIQELFADLWHLPTVAGIRRGFRPAVDCFLSGDPPALTVVVDLAGVDPASVRVVVADRLLVVAGERLRPGAAERVSYRQMEIEYGAFQRQVPLVDEVDVGGAAAAYERGILTITLPVAPARTPKGRVSIPVAGASDG